MNTWLEVEAPESLAVYKDNGPCVFSVSGLQVWGHGLLSGARKLFKLIPGKAYSGSYTARQHVGLGLCHLTPFSLHTFWLTLPEPWMKLPQTCFFPRILCSSTLYTLLEMAMMKRCHMSSRKSRAFWNSVALI